MAGPYDYAAIPPLEAHAASAAYTANGAYQQAAYTAAPDAAAAAGAHYPYDAAAYHAHYAYQHHHPPPQQQHYDAYPTGAAAPYPVYPEPYAAPPVAAAPAVPAHAVPAAPSVSSPPVEHCNVCGSSEFALAPVWSRKAHLSSGLSLGPLKRIQISRPTEPDDIAIIAHADCVALLGGQLQAPDPATTDPPLLVDANPVYVAGLTNKCGCCGKMGAPAGCPRCMLGCHTTCAFVQRDALGVDPHPALLQLPAGAPVCHNCLANDSVLLRALRAEVDATVPGAPSAAASASAPGPTHGRGYIPAARAGPPMSPHRRTVLNGRERPLSPVGRRSPLRRPPSPARHRSPARRPPSPIPRPHPHPYPNGHNDRPHAGRTADRSRSPARGRPRTPPRDAYVRGGRSPLRDPRARSPLRPRSPPRTYQGRSPPRDYRTRSPRRDSRVRSPPRDVRADRPYYRNGRSRSRSPTRRRSRSPRRSRSRSPPRSTARRGERSRSRDRAYERDRGHDRSPPRRPDDRSHPVHRPDDRSHPVHRDGRARSPFSPRRSANHPRSRSPRRSSQNRSPQRKRNRSHSRDRAADPSRPVVAAVFETRSSGRVITIKKKPVVDAPPAAAASPPMSDAPFLPVADNEPFSPQQHLFHPPPAAAPIQSQFIEVRDGRAYCVLCQCFLPRSHDNQWLHLNGARHRAAITAAIASPFVDQDGGMAWCMLCQCTVPRPHTLPGGVHAVGNRHRAALAALAAESDAPSLTGNLPKCVVKNRFKSHNLWCHTCKAAIHDTADALDEHMRQWHYSAHNNQHEEEAQPGDQKDDTQMEGDGDEPAQTPEQAEEAPPTEEAQPTTEEHSPHDQREPSPRLVVSIDA